jgi:hypothetical protein
LGEEAQKQTHFIPGIAALFIEAGGAPPPVAKRDRLSSAWHAGRQDEERPPRQAPSLASERKDNAAP